MISNIHVIWTLMDALLFRMLKKKNKYFLTKAYSMLYELGGSEYQVIKPHYGYV